MKYTRNYRFIYHLSVRSISKNKRVSKTKCSKRKKVQIFIENLRKVHALLFLEYS